MQDTAIKGRIWACRRQHDGTRPQRAALIAKLKLADVVVVYKLDRLGRSLQDLLTILDRIGAAGAAFRSLTEPVDTTTAAGKLMYSILGAVAEFERTLIRQRSMAGQCAAMDRGVKCGQPRSMRAGDESDVDRMWKTRFYSLDNLAQIFDVHPSTVKRAVYRVLSLVTQVCVSMVRYPAIFQMKRIPPPGYQPRSLWPMRIAAFLIFGGLGGIILGFGLESVQTGALEIPRKAGATYVAFRDADQKVQYWLYTVGAIILGSFFLFIGLWTLFAPAREPSRQG